MALSACMWTGVSGLLGHGEKMNVVGNNIANVSTLGFKGQRMDFADFMYQDTFTNNGLAQMGRGVKVGAIMQNFTSGPIETTTEATDLALNGRGFFKVNKVGQDTAFYTRAGNFRFNNDGYLVDPNGLALQGWKVDNSGGVRQAAGGMNLDVIAETKQSEILGTGVPQDIRLDTWTVLPQQTTNVEFKVQLPKGGVDNASDQTNPFAALLNDWDGSQPPASPTTKPMPESSYDYSTTLEVFDEGGTKHKLTVYYDKVDKSSFTGDPNGDVWEYIVTMDPTEDLRQFMDTSSVPPMLRSIQDTKMAGVLMTGTMTFTPGGQLSNQSAYTWGGDQSPDDDPLSFSTVPDPSDPLQSVSVINLDPTNLDNWYPAAISTSGLPIVAPNFSGVLDAQTCGSTNGYKYNVEMDFGMKVGNFRQPWENQLSLGDITRGILPYSVNTGYRAGNPATGPEFLLNNPNYDPTLDLLKDGPNALQYMLNLPNMVAPMPPPAPQVPTYDPAFTPPAAGSPESKIWLETLMNYKGVNKVSIPAGTSIDGVTTTDAIEIEFTAADIANGSLDLSQTPPIINLSTSEPIRITIGGVLYEPNGAGNPVTFQDLLTNETAVPVPPLPGGIFAGQTLSQVREDIRALVRDSIVSQIDTNAAVDRTMFSAATAADYSMVSEMTKPVIIDPSASTNFDGPFSANQAQDGYGYGDLSSWNVDGDGVLYGVYSNGVTLPLWQVTLYDFTCTQGLRREGNNLFSQTRASGEHKFGAAGVSGLGTISGYALEQSNVDMSTEFVQMISTQRGFQANSKIITTTDTMLDTVINMKR